MSGQIQCRDSGRWGVQREFNRRVAELFQARGIQIANPQRTVYVESGGKGPGGKAADGAPGAGTPDAPDAPDTTDTPDTTGAAPPAEQRPGSAKPPTA
jgi:hypothetical protein